MASLYISVPPDETSRVLSELLSLNCWVVSECPLMAPTNGFDYSWVLIFTWGIEMNSPQIPRVNCISKYCKFTSIVNYSETRALNFQASHVNQHKDIWKSNQIIKCYTFVPCQWSVSQKWQENLSCLKFKMRARAVQSHCLICESIIELGKRYKPCSDTVHS